MAVITVCFVQQTTERPVSDRVITWYGVSPGRAIWHGAVVASGIPEFAGLMARVVRTSVRSRTVSYNSIRNSLMRFNSSAILGIALLFGAGRAMAQGAPVVSSTATDTAIASAHKAADVWLDQLDGAQYGPSWDNAGSVFQRALTKAQWIATVQKVRGQVGPLGPRTVQKSQFTTTAPNLPPGEYVVMQYRTVSGSGGFVTETVVLQRDGARGWRVDGYVVKPA